MQTSWTAQPLDHFQGLSSGAEVKKLALKTLREVGFDGDAKNLAVDSTDLRWAVSAEVLPRNNMVSLDLCLTVKSFDYSGSEYDRAYGDLIVPIQNLKLEQLEFDGPLARCVGYNSQMTAVLDRRFELQESQRCDGMRRLFEMVHEYIQTVSTMQELRQRHKEEAFRAAFFHKEARYFVEGL